MFYSVMQAESLCDSDPSLVFSLIKENDVEVLNRIISKDGFDFTICDLDGNKVDEKRLNELLKSLGLENRRKHLPNELSGGQQQRVSIGRALINNPAIILADEPTGNLDSKASEEIVELLKLTNKKYKQTIIMITHNLEIANEADRVLRIEDGKIVKEK